MQVMKRKNKKNIKKIQKASNKSFEILELYEDEPIIFNKISNGDRKQTTTNTLGRRQDKRKIMLVIPSR
jgi:hypothetical protein